MQTEGKIKISNKKRVTRINYRVFVPVKCHDRTLSYKLRWIPNSLACPVVVLSCPACFVFRRSEFQGHLKQLRHAVVWTLLRLSGLSIKTGREGNAREELVGPRSNRGNKIQNGRT